VFVKIFSIYFADIEHFYEWRMSDSPQPTPPQSH